jgi:hypothetical protein
MAKTTSSGIGGPPRPAAENDVYTALVVVSFLFVLAATIYVGFRAQTLFGTLIPPGGA